MERKWSVGTYGVARWMCFTMAIFSVVWVCECNVTWRVFGFSLGVVLGIAMCNVMHLTRDTRLGDLNVPTEL